MMRQDVTFIGNGNSNGIVGELYLPGAALT